eukprot:TRINITY_DN438_c0_g1_i1.p1 TRINITY_DN438_c0_g1~~TRINITY_DN438_c0_g1_i1.p1  ORF type:complete len:564 (+),score=148.19 TRINITY_DN438_c0_g1_i1:69-1760(+)
MNDSSKSTLKRATLFNRRPRFRTSTFSRATNNSDENNQSVEAESVVETGNGSVHTKSQPNDHDKENHASGSKPSFSNSHLESNSGVRSSQVPLRSSSQGLSHPQPKGLSFAASNQPPMVSQLSSSQYNSQQQNRQPQHLQSSLHQSFVANPHMSASTSTTAAQYVATPGPLEQQPRRHHLHDHHHQQQTQQQQQQQHQYSSDILRTPSSTIAVPDAPNSSFHSHQQFQQHQLSTSQMRQTSPQNGTQQQSADIMTGIPFRLAKFCSIMMKEKSEKDLFVINGKPYIRLSTIGRGASSKVFKVMSHDCKTYALKKVRFSNTTELKNLSSEILLLKRLRKCDVVIKLMDFSILRDRGQILVLLELGEMDLLTALRRQQSKAAKTGSRAVDHLFLRITWRRMLEAVALVHQQRIVHSDLKPANFVFVEGELKLIDFGIAKAISGDTTSIDRDTSVGTINYMSPEAIQAGQKSVFGAPATKVGRPSDVWSLGCILYEMSFGRPPFADYSVVEKLQRICDPRVTIRYPQHTDSMLLDVIQRCLQRDPKLRPPIEGDGGLLSHPFLTGN